ncbi:MAG TPA: hypothetical protein VFN89_04530 [Solirubrobacterales bacterium]|nr:hypothetical protein [Solirubrobacterales bacterium]
MIDFLFSDPLKCLGGGSGTAALVGRYAGLGILEGGSQRHRQSARFSFGFHQQLFADTWKVPQLAIIKK